MAPQNDESRADGNSEFDILPEKRGNRAKYCSSILFISATIIVATILIMSPHFVFKEDKEAVCTRKNSGESLICYKKEKKHLAGFPAITFGILSAILGTLFQRLTLIAEEYRHKESRYGGSWTKMSKACFSGVKWQAVMCAAIAFVAIIWVMFATNEDIDFNRDVVKYTVVLLGSIGFGPLVLHLLDLDTLSALHEIASIQI